MDNDSIPFVAIGNDELGGALGATIRCPQCGSKHRVRNSNPGGKVQYIKCPADGNSYLVGIERRKINRA